MPPALKDFSWDRMIAAVEAVKERMLRAANAIELAVTASSPSRGFSK